MNNILKGSQYVKNWLSFFGALSVNTVDKDILHCYNELVTKL